MNLFVTAIGTDSGKTLASAILCEALHADYWKPVQAGLPTDSDSVKSLITNKRSVIHPEAFRLKTPASPHAAAAIDGVEIRLRDFHLPDTSNTLVIEGAGGCMVPLNESEFVIDFAKNFSLPVILVANLYLGSINHTLLTMNLLKQMQLSVKGIIFNGASNPESERIILHHTQAKVLLRINPEMIMDQSVVRKYANDLLKNW